MKQLAIRLLVLRTLTSGTLYDLLVLSVIIEAARFRVPEFTEVEERAA